jgi:hypothetical protein
MVQHIMWYYYGRNSQYIEQLKLIIVSDMQMQFLYCLLKYQEMNASYCRNYSYSCLYFPSDAKITIHVNWNRLKVTE